MKTERSSDGIPTTNHPKIMSGLDGLGWPTNDDNQEAGGDCPSAPCCAFSDLDAVKSWGPLVIADVVGGDLADNTVTLRIHGPMPGTILGAQWFIFHDAPPAAERLQFPFLHNAKSPSTDCSVSVGVGQHCAAVGDPTGKLMQDELVDRCRRMSAVIDAARCIRHWHDREGGGMVVSAEHVRKLWAALHDLEANASAMASADDKTTPKETTL